MGLDIQLDTKSRQASDLARPLGCVAVDAELPEACDFFREHPDDTHLAVRAGTRIVGLLTREQVDLQIQRNGVSSGARPLPIAALPLADCVLVRADCEGGALDREIGRWTSPHGKMTAPVVVTDGADLLGLILPEDLPDYSTDSCAPSGSGCRPAIDPDPTGPQRHGTTPILHPEPKHRTTALHALLGGCSVPSAVFGDAHRLLYANPAFLGIIDLSQSATPLGMPWTDLFEEPIPQAGAKPFSTCPVRCSASQALTLKQRGGPPLIVEADVDRINDGRHVLVSIVRCVAPGRTPFEHCFCRFQATRHASKGEAKCGAAHMPALPGSTQPGSCIMGALDQFSLIEIVQFLAHSEKTGVLEILPADPLASPGEIAFERGQMRHAALGETSGEDALRSLLALNRGFFRFAETSRTGPTTIQGNTCAILLATCVAQDEDGMGASKTSNPTPPAVRANGHH